MRESNHDDEARTSTVDARSCFLKDAKNPSPAKQKKRPIIRKQRRSDYEEASPKERRVAELSTEIVDGPPRSQKDLEKEGNWDF